MKVIVQNMAIEYEDSGQGPVVLFLHGWMDTLHSWDALLPKLNEYRCVRLDLPGFGHSDAPPEDWYVADYAALVRDFLEKLAIVPRAIVGHSFGGRVAIKGLSGRQLSAERLVLIASAGVAQRRKASPIMKLVSLCGKVISRIPFVSRYYEDMRRSMYERMGSDYYRAGRLRGTFLNAIQEDLSDAAHSVKVPTLLIWGAGDTQTPLSEGKSLERLIEGSKLVVFDDASHFVHREKVDEVAREIKTFL